MAAPRVKRDPDATREALLTAAAELFSARGYSGTSVRELAERAGVTKSLIHHHFGGKEGLWHAVLEDLFRDTEAAALHAVVGDGVPTARLSETMMRLMFRGFLDKPELARLLAWSYLERVPLPEPDSASLDQGLDRIREAQRTGGVRPDVEPRNVMLVFMALTEFFHVAGPHKAAILRMDLGDPAVIERFLDDAVRIFVHGVSGPGGCDGEAV